MAGRRVDRRSPGAPLRTAPLFFLLALMLSLPAFLGGCGVDIGPTQEVTVNEPLGAAAVTEVKISMGAGTLSLSPGASGLAAGVIRFNVEAWRPVVERTDSRLTIEQGSQKGLAGLGADIVNKWTLQLGAAPMRLQVSAGAYEGTYDLSGLTLQGLSIKDGAAKSKVMFNSANPGQMDRLKYETGASTVSLIGLANANFKDLEFKGGAGTFTLDFSGQLRTDGGARVEAGVGTVRIVVPAQTAARVTVNGALNHVSLEGQWTADGKTYSNPAAMSAAQGRSLTIDVEMSVGSLSLVTE
jgi:hypothetical protein